MVPAVRKLVDKAVVFSAVVGVVMATAGLVVIWLLWKRVTPQLRLESELRSRARRERAGVEVADAGRSSAPA